MTKRQKEILMILVNSHPLPTALTTPDHRVAKNTIKKGWVTRTEEAIPRYSLTESGVKACKDYNLMY